MITPQRCNFRIGGLAYNNILEMSQLEIVIVVVV